MGSKTGPPQINCSMLTHFKGKICLRDAVRRCGICHLVTTPTLGKRMRNPPAPSKEHFTHILRLKFNFTLMGCRRRRNRMTDRPNSPSLPAAVSSVTPITSLTFRIVLHRLSVFARAHCRHLCEPRVQSHSQPNTPEVRTQEFISGHGVTLNGCTAAHT